MGGSGSSPAPTPTPTPTPTPSSTALATFDEATAPTFVGFGGATGAIATDPAGGTNKVAKLIKASGAETWGGVTIVKGTNQSIGTIALSSTAKTLTMRVYSPKSGVPIRLKLEDAADPTHTIETEAVTTVAGTWQTLTFNMGSPASGTAAFNAAYTYNKASVFPNFGAVPLADETYYVDDLTFLGGSGGTPAPTPTPTPTPTSTPTMAAGFNTANTTTNGGVWGTYAGDGGVTSGAGGGFADSSPVATPNYIFSYTQLSSTSPAAYSYQGIYFQPASTANVSAVSKTALGYTMGVNPEWFGAAGGAKFVILISANVPGVSTPTCDPKVSAVVQATSANAVAYVTPLSAFTGIAQNCGVSTVTAATILANRITQISFEADGGGAALTASGLISNTNRSVAASGLFTTTISVSPPLAFQ